ncbi:MAG: hypothetical protein IPK19_21305 [Chloroflexi bacterium]|nr:hypothetical protein [Chloroflexota bacterium]
MGNWLTDGYPSPLMRFLLCLGVEPDIVEPGKPTQAVCRALGTDAQTRMPLADPPADWLDAAGILDTYRSFYNAANQSLACWQPPA